LVFLALWALWALLHPSLSRFFENKSPIHYLYMCVFVAEPRRCQR
jgi:hypothetical protein